MLRARGFLGLLLALAQASTGCTIVIGERPDVEPGADADADGDATASDERDGARDEPDAEVTPGSDAGEGQRDAGGGDASQTEDSGSEAGPPDGTLDAAMPDPDSSTGQPDAMMDGSGWPSQDAATTDTSTPLDTGTGEDTGSGCTTMTTWYPDEDGDGFGRAAGSVQACSKPSGKWSESSDDCNDDVKDAHPGQTAYFGSPYASGNAKGSFDYDCNGAEDGNAGQSALKDGCGGLLGLLCSNASGYSPTPRTGPGLNSMCGSEILVHCQVSGLSCVAGSPEQAPMPYACH